MPSVGKSMGVAEKLVADVIAAGGTLKVNTSGLKWGSSLFANRVRIANRTKVPDGQRLELVEGRGPGIYETHVLITLVDGPTIRERPVPVPQRAGRHHPAVVKYRAQTSAHEVSRTSMARATRILSALAFEAERRGYTVHPGGRDVAQRGHLGLEAGGYRMNLRIREEGVAAADAYDGRPHYPESAVRKFEKERLAHGTGQLRIDLVLAGRRAKFGDSNKSTLEERLPALLAEFEHQAEEHAERERQRERARAERRRRWEAAMERARGLHHEQLHVDLLRLQAGRYDEVRRIRTLCDEIERRYPDDEEAMAWVTWCLEHATSIDPIATPPRRPERPDHVRPDELAPFLGGWSPYGP